MFEYKTENFEIIIGGTITVDDKLNVFGKDGWECFNIKKKTIYDEQYGKYMIHTSTKYFVKLKRCVSAINNEYDKKFNLPLDLKYEMKNTTNQQQCPIHDVSNSNLINGGYYWIKREFDWVIGSYYNELFQLTTGELIGFKTIEREGGEIDYKQIVR